MSCTSRNIALSLSVFMALLISRLWNEKKVNPTKVMTRVPVLFDHNKIKFIRRLVLPGHPIIPYPEDHTLEASEEKPRRVFDGSRHDTKRLSIIRSCSPHLDFIKIWRFSAPNSYTAPSFHKQVERGWGNTAAN